MKQTLLLSLLVSLLTGMAFAQSVKITTMVEGDCPTGEVAPRFIELYVDGTVDVTNLKIQFQFASASNWVTNNSIGVGQYTDTFLYLVNDIDAFDENFAGIRTAQNTTVGTLLSSVEGGDKVRLVDASNNDNVLDIFGIDGENGESKSWNFSNSFVTRNNGSGPSNTFIESEWNINTKNTLLFAGVCWEEDPLDTMVTLQGYTLSVNDVLTRSNKIKYYPNPAKKMINISGLNTAQSFVMYDILGHQVMKGIIHNNENLDLSDLNSGIYLLKTENGQTLKIFKE
ncbi:T9SS type A sorting domain-containing protein [Winogradskyella eckloniae]|uniref:T9SS type A sorting domain-containing protein n=1 Tax=Winogradskyella eckloniae TaxID=1089306 RepID=UPI0015634C8E|nr:T9SS type A sorting domain-containing protein [Winogradskyella eckloniae]NRD20286.1 T9SS type A sorting domain-containing protein [Winogradskyella eckloniae]